MRGAWRRGDLRWRFRILGWSAGGGKGKGEGGRTWWMERFVGARVGGVKGF